MELIKEVLIIIDIFTAISFVYFIITGLCVLMDKKEIKDGTKKHKFAIIIPARNEAKVIGNLLKSLNKQEYPKELYDVYVVINNCKDNTKTIAQENKAKIIECLKPISSKGTALRTAFAKLSSVDYDAYLIFDADNIAHPQFIKKMNDALCSGYDLAQGFRDSKNPSDTWISCSYSIHYLIHNVFLNKSRMNLDKSCFINGTGIMISKKHIDKKGYKAHTLTEDIELTVRSALENEKVAFVENAITYDEQVETFRDSWKQRKRWSIGTIQCFKYYFVKLFKYAVKNRSFSCLDAIFFLSTPFMQFLGVISYIAHFIVAWAYGLPINYAVKILGLALGYLASIALSIAAIKFSKKHIATYIKGIIMLPIFVLSWVPINVAAVFSKKSRWEEIQHSKDVSIESILEE